MSGVTLEDISGSQTELILIRVPKKFKASSLNGTSFKFKKASCTPGKVLSSVEHGGTQYNIQAEDNCNSSQLMNVFHSTELNSLCIGKPFSTVLSVVENCDREPSSVSVPFVMPYERVPQVTGMQQRFRPAGAPLLKKPEKRLREEDVGEISSSKKKQKNKVKTPSKQQAEVKSEDSSKKKKKKKSKASVSS